MLCSECNKNKDSRLFEKDSDICKVCVKGPSKSIAEGSTKGSMKGAMIGQKRSNAPLDKNAVLKKIADEDDEEMKEGDNNDG